jgi:hypothetical protein
MSNKIQILKNFGFDVQTENKKSNKPETVTLIIKTGQHYRFKTDGICKISALIASSFSENDVQTEPVDKIEVPEIINDKFMVFLLDYAEYICKHGIPVYNTDKIRSATTLENAIGSNLYLLFVKHFDYKFMRSDLAVKQYLNIFGYFLECSSTLVADSLITLFAIAHKIIIQHLPGSEFIAVDD